VTRGGCLQITLTIAITHHRFHFCSKPYVASHTPSICTLPPDNNNERALHKAEMTRAELQDSSENHFVLTASHVLTSFSRNRLQVGSRHDKDIFGDVPGTVGAKFAVVTSNLARSSLAECIVMVDFLLRAQTKRCSLTILGLDRQRFAHNRSYWSARCL